jgi:mycofactocin precursor
MSQSEPGTREDVESTERTATAEVAEDAQEDEQESAAEEPDIEEDLFEEELRIDGICGVY